MPFTVILPLLVTSPVDEGFVPDNIKLQALPTERLREAILLMLTTLNTALLHAATAFAAVLKVKVPPFALNVPDVIVNELPTANVPDVEVNIPVLRLKLPIMVIEPSDPVKVPSD